MLPEGTEITFYFNLILTALTAGIDSSTTSRARFQNHDESSIFLDCNGFSLLLSQYLKVLLEFLINRFQKADVSLFRCLTALDMYPLTELFICLKRTKSCFYSKAYANKSQLKFYLGLHKCSENTNKNAVKASIKAFSLHFPQLQLKYYFLFIDMDRNEAICFGDDAVSERRQQKICLLIQLRSM